MTDLPVAQVSFRLGGVLAKSLHVVGRHLVAFLAVNLLAGLPVLVIMAATGDVPEQSTVLDLLTAPISFVLVCLAQAMTIQGTWRALHGEPFLTRDALSSALPRLLPTIGASVLSMVLILTGFAALFIPGLIAIGFLYVTLPACALERKGAVESMERSGELTKGYRWTILVVFALTNISALVTSAGLGDLRTPSPILDACDEAVSLLYLAFNAVLSAVCFADLRRIKDSDVSSNVAPIFD
jgi:hypothetical protein